MEEGEWGTSPSRLKVIRKCLLDDGLVLAETRSITRGLPQTQRSITHHVSRLGHAQMDRGLVQGTLIPFLT